MSRKVALGRAECEAILAEFGATNSRVAVDYLDRKDGVLFRDPVEAPERTIEAQIDVEGMARLSAFVMNRMADDEKRKHLTARLKTLNERVKALSAQNERLRRANTALAERRGNAAGARNDVSTQSRTAT